MPPGMDKALPTGSRHSASQVTRGSACWMLAKLANPAQMRHCLHHVGCASTSKTHMYASWFVPKNEMRAHLVLGQKPAFLNRGHSMFHFLLPLVKAVPAR